MRRSKILFSAIAIAAGLLIGLANPKEAKAAARTVKASEIPAAELQSGVWICSQDTILDLDQNVTLKGIVCADSYTAGSPQYNLTIKGSGKLTLQDNSGIPLQVKKLTVNGGATTVNATGNYLAILGENIEISGGSLTAESASNCMKLSGNIIAKGGKLSAKGSGWGIECQDMSVEGDADVYVEGGGGKVGIKAENSFIFLGGKFEAKGGSYALLAWHALDIPAEEYLVEPSGGVPGNVFVSEGGSLRVYKTINVSQTQQTGAKHVILRSSTVTTKYQITVQADHGTASADHNEAEEGATINLSATPDDGYEFDKWTSGTQGVSFDDASSANTSFEMPARNVTVSANFIKKGSDSGDDKKDDKKDKKDKKDSGKHHKHKHSDDSSSDFVVNPDAIVAFYIVNGAVDGKAKLGKQEQGPVCKSLFTASCPKGWIEAFSMSMSYDGVYTSTLKNGTLQLYIPAQYQKAGRQYAVMAMDKYGKVHIYQDTDALPFVFTSPLNFEGYAFSVIYKD